MKLTGNEIKKLKSSKNADEWNKFCDEIKKHDKVNVLKTGMN